jgi:hypothetical protein
LDVDIELWRIKIEAELRKMEVEVGDEPSLRLSGKA